MWAHHEPRYHLSQGGALSRISSPPDLASLVTTRQKKGNTRLVPSCTHTHTYSETAPEIAQLSWPARGPVSIPVQTRRILHMPTSPICISLQGPRHLANKAHYTGVWGANPGAYGVHLLLLWTGKPQHQPIFCHERLAEAYHDVLCLGSYRRVHRRCRHLSFSIRVSDVWSDGGRERECV